MKLLALTPFALAATLMGGVAMADTIEGLVNTGSGLSSGATDKNYAYTVSGGDYSGQTGYGVVSSGSTDPFPHWIANTESSSWLILGGDQQTNYSSSSDSVVTWSLSFDLTGYDISSASITGRWASDNSGVLLLNGQAISTIEGNGYTGWTDFSSITSYFTTGVNTLSFVVTDDANSVYNYTGVRVEFASAVANALPSTTPLTSPVPEPQTYALMIAGIAALGFLARRRS
ncbi:PEP-CTERM sorting domain-containing protein [Roseateles sp. SL47]|uniref:PEP-CTERM sorting domain-containing protein n=1 Tax=Roseateles sp. SL47 TaxID=2995138 RepID=UPI002271D69C|nr:PEP-CTERM sorting domain-containing protein [Roseateles sp. SL47]WAC74012.1 PEP-CTERM sorting domain-containing protein [Roseateles sp. SL47]